jgi:hypothetical protein
LGGVVIGRVIIVVKVDEEDAGDKWRG